MTAVRRPGEKSAFVLCRYAFICGAINNRRRVFSFN